MTGHGLQFARGPPNSTKVFPGSGLEKKSSAMPAAGLGPAFLKKVFWAANLAFTWQRSKKPRSNILTNSSHFWTPTETPSVT